jgi:hypothetical protein
LGCDANDPVRLAQFWARALGYVAEPGFDDPDGASIIDPEGNGPAIGWLRVPEGAWPDSRGGGKSALSSRTAGERETASRSRSSRGWTLGCGAEYVVRR